MLFYDGFGADILVWGGVLFLLLLILVQSYNTFLISKNKVKKTFAEMNVQLRKRFDLIPDFIDAIKTCMAQESAMFSELLQLRSTAIKPNARVADKCACEHAFSEFYRDMLAKSTAYSQLQTNKNFLRLQQKIKDTEAPVSASGKAYNEAVIAYNKEIQSFPVCLFASYFHARQESLFKYPAEERKKHRR